MIHVQTCQPATRWNPLPAIFTLPGVRPTVGFLAPTQFKSGSHGTYVKRSYADTWNARNIRRWQFVSSIRGEPTPFQLAPVGMSTINVRRFYVDQLEQLTPERNSIQFNSGTKMSSIHFHVHRWLKSKGLHEQGWRAKGVTSHPGDGKPRVWVVPPETQEPIQ